MNSRRFAIAPFSFPAAVCTNKQGSVVQACRQKLCVKETKLFFLLLAFGFSNNSMKHPIVDHWEKLAVGFDLGTITSKHPEVTSTHFLHFSSFI